VPVTILVPRYQRRDRVDRAILDLRPTLYLPMRDPVGPLRDASGGRWDAAVTGSPTLGVAAPSPIGRGVVFSGTGQYATTDGGVPTPTASMSVLSIFVTTNASAANRTIAGRGASSQFSWVLRIEATHIVAFRLFQSDGSAHGGTSTTGAVNDGAIHLALGTFDGTTLRTYRDDQAASPATPSGGTWHKASTAGIQIAALNSTSLLPGTACPTAYWADRVISDGERLMVNAIAKGG